MPLDTMDALALAVELRLNFEHISRTTRAELDRSKQLLERQRVLRQRLEGNVYILDQTRRWG